MPIAKAWVRTVNSSTDWTTGFLNLGAFSPPTTIVRIRFGWGFQGITPVTGTLLGVMQNLQVLGLCTTVGAGGGPPPNPRTHSGDVLPPSQRWLHWEARAPVIQTADGTTELVTWRHSEPQEAIDVKAMVSSATVPAGEFMTLWASWAAAYDWPADGLVHMWLWASILVQVAF